MNVQTEVQYLYQIDRNMIQTNIRHTQVGMQCILCQSGSPTVLFTTKVEVGDPDQESGPIVVWIIAEIAAAADAIAEHLSKHKTATNGQHKAAAGTTNFQE